MCVCVCERERETERERESISGQFREVLCLFLWRHSDGVIFSDMVTTVVIACPLVWNVLQKTVYHHCLTSSLLHQTYCDRHQKRNYENGIQYFSNK